MQESLYQTVDAGLFISDSRCKNLSNRECWTVFKRQWMQETLYHNSKCRTLSDSYAGPSLTESVCRKNFPDSECSSFSIRQEMQDSIRQRMQKTLYQTGDAGISLSLRQQMLYSLYWTERQKHSIRQRMQETLYQKGDAGDTLSDRRCRSFSTRQRMQETP